MSAEGIMNTMKYYDLCYKSYKTYAVNKENLSIFKIYALTTLLFAAHQSAGLVKAQGASLIGFGVMCTYVNLKIIRFSKYQKDSFATEGKKISNFSHSKLYTLMTNAEDWNADESRVYRCAHEAYTVAHKKDQFFQYAMLSAGVIGGSKIAKIATLRTTPYVGIVCFTTAIVTAQMAILAYPKVIPDLKTLLGGHSVRSYPQG